MIMVGVIVGLPQWYLQTASVLQHRGGSFFFTFLTGTKRTEPLVQWCLGIGQRNRW